MAEAKGYTPEKAIVCIREDGYLCMANALAINHSMTNPTGRLRPYHGPLDATLEQRMKYLNGDKEPDAVRDLKIALEKGPANIDEMNRLQLIDFAMDEFGLDLSKKTSMKEETMRERIREVMAGAAKPAAAGIGVSA